MLDPVRSLLVHFHTVFTPSMNGPHSLITPTSGAGMMGRVLASFFLRSISFLDSLSKWRQYLKMWVCLNLG